MPDPTTAGTAQAPSAPVMQPQVGAASSAPLAEATQTAPIPGTDLYVPTGTGIETLQAIMPPFRSNAPPWYANGVWGQMGCAVSQPGRYVQTDNEVIWDFVTGAGRQLFNVFWNHTDRKYARWPSVTCLWDVYELLIFGRKWLNDNAVQPQIPPLEPTHAKPAPQMFVANPIPLYGALGCTNLWLGRVGKLSLMMLTEAMQHTDNDLSFHVTLDFFSTIYPYVKYLLVDLAKRFFNVDPKLASADDFTISQDLWNAYAPQKNSVSTEGVTTRPPMGWDPPDLDLEAIRDLPYSEIVPFLQPWPDSQLKYSSAGVWQGQPQAAQPNNPPSASGHTQTATALAAMARRGPPTS